MNWYLPIKKTYVFKDIIFISPNNKFYPMSMEEEA